MEFSPGGGETARLHHREEDFELIESRDAGL